MMNSNIRRLKPPVVRDAVRHVGVRELRQNLSVYLARVQAGEALTVTDHGQEVAILRPMPKEDSPLRRMVAEGRATPPVRTLSDLKVPVAAAARPTIEVLDELRDDRF